MVLFVLFVERNIFKNLVAVVVFKDIDVKIVVKPLQNTQKLYFLALKKIMILGSNTLI